MDYKERYEVERKISAQYEFAINALLKGELESYLMLRQALEFAKEQREEIKNARRISDSNKLEES